MMQRLLPMLASPAAPFDGEDYLFEVKLYDRFCPLDQYSWPRRFLWEPRGNLASEVRHDLLSQVDSFASC